MYYVRTLWYVCIYVCMYVCMYVYIYVCMYVYICMYVHVYPFNFVCMNMQELKMSTSSKSSKCGLTNKAAARAARMAHPPLRLRVGRHIVSSEKPRPSKIFRARTCQKTFFENIIDDHIHKVIVQCVCVYVRQNLSMKVQSFVNKYI